VGSEIRTAAPAHATGAVVFVPLEEIAPDVTFRLRPEGDVSVLAASIGRLGQLQPVELRALPGVWEEGPRFQALAGFRRLAALRLLFRDRVLARVHEALADDDAWGIALVEGLTGEPLAEPELLELRDRLVATGVAPWALELVEEARARAPLPPEQRERFYELLTGAGPVPKVPARPDGEKGTAEAWQVEEVNAEDFARDLALRLAETSRDLATAYGAWKDLPEEGRRLLLVQARYVAQLLPYLEDAER
jgi:hypothetical protein